MKIENLNIKCISLQSKRNERYMQISKYYSSLNLKEEIAIEGNNKIYIEKLERELNINFDNIASYPNKALFIKSLKLWKDHLKSNNNYVIIIEDDVIPIKNFLYRFKLVTKELPEDFDICVMTGVIFDKPKQYSNLLYGKTEFSCIGAYLLSKNGAKKLIKIAENQIIKSHPTGGVLDYWICCNKNNLNFYKTKVDLFTLLNIPSSLAVSRCKLLENNIPKIDNFFKNNYIFTIMFNNFGINGKVTISYYLFLNFFINYLLIRMFGFLITFLVVILLYIIDIKYYRYLLEEKINKLLEILFSIIIVYIL